MAQQYPQSTGRGGGRGGLQPYGQGGRGQGGRGGRGNVGGHPNMNPNAGRPNVGAWQPTAPTSLQQAAYGRQPAVQQHAGAYPPYFNPYAAPQGAVTYGQPPRGAWPGQPPYPPHPQPGLYYPGPSQQVAQPPATVPPHKPREKRPLVITDKSGKILDFRSEAAKNQKAAPGGPSTSEEKSAPIESRQDAGSKLKQAALDALNRSETTQPPDTSDKPKAEEKNEKPNAPTTKEEPPKEEISAKEDVTGESAKPEPKKPQTVTKEIVNEEPKKAEPSPEKPEAPIVEPAKPVAPAKEEVKPKAPVEAKQATPVEVKVAPPKRNEKPKQADKPKPSGQAPSVQPSVEKPVEKETKPETPSTGSVGGGLRPGGMSKMRNAVAAASASASSDGSKGRRVYTKELLLQMKETEVCTRRPADLPDMTVTRGPAKGNNRNNRGGGGGGNWDRGQSQNSNRRNSNHNDNNNGGGGQWARGQAPPRQQNRGGRGGRRNSQGPPMNEGPVAPLVRSENGWKPKKSTNPLIIAEKQVRSILNKMTKEKFDKLSGQMVAIPIMSYDMLTMMIHVVYEKAIDEPAFGDMYADLCVKLSKGALQETNDFVKILTSDEEPPTESGETGTAPADSSSHLVYRWSNDVNTVDDEIVGPFDSADACISAALGQNGARTPVKRGDMELDLVQLLIRKGMFIKVMKKKGANEKEKGAYYVVYFAVSDAKEVGQQISEIFLSEVECVSSAKKKNSFKRSLLNKCEDEFKKQDIYVGWKAEMKAYEDSKSSLTQRERDEQEEELNFRRIKIKKQMLGNIKFIGQLYKKGLLKEKIMRFCIGSLLKLEQLKDVKSKNPEYKDAGDIDMDEEDHEAICSMFTTIGSTIDKAPAADFMKVCFTKIDQLSVSKSLPSRSRFMYKDLLDLRKNSWIPRRKEEKAKTLDEIRKDVEREEKIQAQQSQQNYRNDNRRGAGGDYRNDYRNRQNSNRSRQPKKEETDDDGFTTVISRGVKGTFSSTPESKQSQRSQRDNKQQQQQSSFRSNKQNNAPSAIPEQPKTTAPAPLDSDKLDRRIKSIRNDFVFGKNVEELLLSIDEISGTSDYGLTFVTKNADRMFDCKEAECQGIAEMFKVVCEKGKIKKDDLRNGLMDSIEFIDSILCDCPKAFDIMGEVVAILLNLKALDVQWLCEQCEKTKVDPDTQAPEKLVRSTIVRASADVKTMFSKSGGALNSLLGADKWRQISAELLA